MDSEQEQPHLTEEPTRPSTLQQLREQLQFYKEHQGLFRYDLLRWAFHIKIVFLDLYPVHYQFSRPVIVETAMRQRVLLVVSSNDHPSLRDQLPANVHIVVLPDVLDQLRHMKIDWLITPASDLHPWRIPAETNTIHLYHSLVSMHSAYREDAFDGYDHFFACGPHHVKEIASFAKLREWERRSVYNVGYPKVDVLSSEYRQSVRTAPSQPYSTVLLAPSWHESNLLTRHGVEMARSIISMGLRLIIRPHPHTFDVDPETIRNLLKIVREYPDQCTLEDSASGTQSICAADVMISDWSGVAYEFAFATERPVLFINSPQKINSRDFARHKLPAMEDVCRSQIGIVIEHADETELGLRQLMESSRSEWAGRIRAVRLKHLFNFGSSAKVAADLICRMVTEQPVEKLPVGSAE